MALAIGRGLARVSQEQMPVPRTTPRAKAWAKLMARVGEEFPRACPGCGGDIRLIALHPSRCRSGRSSRTSANRPSHLRFHLREARPPTGENSCSRMTTGPPRR